jgi:hypothetical protein
LSIFPVCSQRWLCRGQTRCKAGTLVGLVVEAPAERAEEESEAAVLAVAEEQPAVLEVAELEVAVPVVAVLVLGQAAVVAPQAQGEARGPVAEAIPTSVAPWLATA